MNTLQKATFIKSLLKASDRSCGWARIYIPKGSILPVLEIHDTHIFVEFNGQRVGVPNRGFYKLTTAPPVAL